MPLKLVCEACGHIDGTPLPIHPVPVIKEHQLTEREQEISYLVGCGFKNREIADKFFISEQTVKNHLHNIFDKTGVKGRLELALWLIWKSQESLKIEEEPEEPEAA